MMRFRAISVDTEEVIETQRIIHPVNTGNELFIPCALFAMLVSPDRGGIIPSESEMFTAKETKTACKFGKSWALGAQPSHLTIRIGPQAAAHMRERAERLAFENRRMPIETVRCALVSRSTSGTFGVGKSSQSKGMNAGAATGDCFPCA